MRYYIYDLHFYHENLNYQMDHRGFSNAAERNAHMIHSGTAGYGTRMRWSCWEICPSVPARKPTGFCVS